MDGDKGRFRTPIAAGIFGIIPVLFFLKIQVTLILPFFESIFAFYSKAKNTFSNSLFCFM